jgi:hypothetical protein
MSRVIALFVCLVSLFVVHPALAQNARDGRVQVTVVDQTGGVVPGATVTLIGIENATESQTLAPATTDEKGITNVERVPPGRYSIRAEFPGFDLGLLRDIRVRTGDNKHVVVLPLAKLEQNVTVGRNQQEAASDRRSSEFGNTVKQEQIDALSDDPAELQRQLQELAGPDAIIRVDSFEGQQLPPKAQIKSIHVVRDQFAAEASDPSSTFVDIVTQPGIGPVRGGLNFNFFDDVLAAKSPFLTTKAAEQSRNFGGNIGGALVEGRTSFSANINGQSMYTTPSLTVAEANGTRRFEVLGSKRAPREFVNGTGILDHAITKDQTLRLSYNFGRQALHNLGVGNYDLPERAFGGRQLNNQFRVQEAGPLGRRAFINTRLAYRQMDLDLASETEAPTVIVLDAFNSGGAQQQQDTRLQGFTLASDVDYVRGVHSFRVGLQSDADWARNIQRTNYLGTYTYGSLDDYNANRPLVFTQIVGDPRVEFFSIRNAVYVQDDIKLKGLTLSPGLRYSQQNLVEDWSGAEPRFGLTWSPRANGATTLRASAGIFHGFLPPQLYEQTLRVNGERQREITIPYDLETGLPRDAVSVSSKYLLGDFNLQRNVRYSAGIDQVLSPRVRVNVLYNWIHLQQQPRGNNLNPTINGVRPDPNYANVIEVLTDTEIRRHEVFVNSTISLAAPSPALQQARFNWRRMNVQAGYTMIHVQNNSAGPFVPPPTGNIDDDWGPGPQDAPYRFNIVATGTQLRNLTTVLTWLANSGQVYNETTGFDDNGDGIVNDRRPGVGLRSLRGDGQFQMNARISYAFVLGGQPSAPGAQARYRLNVFANINNVTNHRNYANYSGVMRSQFYQTPTVVINPRRADIGMNLTF